MMKSAPPEKKIRTGFYSDSDPNFKRGIVRALPLMIVFFISFIYFTFHADYVLYNREQSKLFIFSGDFIKEYFKQPGGILVLITTLLDSFSFYSVAGALIISLLLASLFVLTRKLILANQVLMSVAVPTVITAVFFYLITDYRLSTVILTGVLVQLLLFLPVIVFPGKKTFTMAVLVMPLLHYVTGSFAVIYLLLVTVYIIISELKAKWIYLTVLFSFAITALFISYWFIFPLPLQDLITHPAFPIESKTELLLFSFSLLLICLLPLSSVILTNKNEIVSKMIIYLLSPVIIPTIFLSIVCVLRYDIRTRNFFAVEKLFFAGRYDDVIRHNNSYLPGNRITLYMNNISLSESNLLDDMLFHFPQDPSGATLFLNWDKSAQVLNKGGYFYYSTGMINEAHRWAYENMVMSGYTAEGLKMLISTDIINRNYEAALKYSGMLRRTLFYRVIGERYEKLIDSGNALPADKGLMAKKTISAKADFFTFTDNPLLNLDRIISSDSLNRQAFEYKVAWLMISKNMKELNNVLPVFSKMGYKRLPVHVEEAALALSAATNKLPDTGNIEISSKTNERWRGLLQTLSQYNNNLRAARNTIKDRYGDTFWYWVFYK